MPFFLQATTATAADAAWVDTSTLATNTLIESSTASATATGTSEALLGSGVAFASNSLAVGDIIRFNYVVQINATGSKATTTFRVRLGGLAGSIVATTAGASSQVRYDNDFLTIEGWFRVSAIGGSGNVVASSTLYTPNTSGAGEFISFSDFTIAADTTTSLTLVMTYTTGSVGDAFTQSAAVWKQSAPS